MGGHIEGRHTGLPLRNFIHNHGMVPVGADLCVRPVPSIPFRLLLRLWCAAEPLLFFKNSGQKSL